MSYPQILFFFNNTMGQLKGSLAPLIIISYVNKKSQMKIAFIDDKTDNLQAWLSSMETITGGEAILDIYDSIDAFDEALQEGYQPQVVFTDYNIDDRCGTELVEILRGRFGHQVYIIAHSSGDWRNRHLLQVGADEMIPKFKGITPSPTVADRFWSYEDLLALDQSHTEEE